MFVEILLLLFAVLFLVPLGMASQTSPDESPIGAFDRKGAARYLSISTRLLDDLAARGDIKRLKQGRKALYRRIDLDAYLARLAGEVV